MVFGFDLYIECLFRCFSDYPRLRLPWILTFVFLKIAREDDLSYSKVCTIFNDPAQ